MFFSYGCMFWRCIYNRSGRSLVEGLVVFLPLVIGLWIHTSHVAQPKWCAILWWYNFFGEPCSNEKVHKKLSVFEFMVRKSKKHTIWKKQFGSNQWELLQEAGHFQNNWWNTSWWLNQPIWKILVSKWESSPNGDEHKKYLSCHHLEHVIHQQFLSCLTNFLCMTIQRMNRPIQNHFK